jgi:hypothetical protein
MKRNGKLQSFTGEEDEITQREGTNILKLWRNWKVEPLLGRNTRDNPMGRYKYIQDVAQRENTIRPKRCGSAWIRIRNTAKEQTNILLFLIKAF